ncbi:MAG TPA: 1-(5-phosphoribosyl)-5-amino-4-imidazole-carboxylate carboxylase, partial [Thermoanaerobacterales bacterium]|nr:1-(5-phosphoribosyl)-5-amino-4-imidazole-carboxylate carboxylase [Thermoanaerobacterales bacterium]
MEKLRGLLERLQAGDVTVSEVLKELKNLPYED